MLKNSKLSTESYKGVRDFYPEDLFVQNYIFNTWKGVVESFGYQEYNASVLEPAELYKSKSGEEIVNEQTYTFLDRGEREVTLRPEMTPTVARMVAQKLQELSFPLRWYSIPNLFRYEKPQKGRLREHWQLNVDMFGIETNKADIEILQVAHKIMTEFGARENDFLIKINNRKIINSVYKKFDLNEEDSYKISKIIDKKGKISDEVFEESLNTILKNKTKDFINLLSSNEKIIDLLGEQNHDVKELIELIEFLNKEGINNLQFDSTLMRGFDYYTGLVFEVFDTDKENNRSLFGGGRYDDLLQIFDSKKIPAVGFGAGDVTMMDFLKTHNLLPEYKPKTDLNICVIKEDLINEANILAKKLREFNLNVSVNISNKKIGDQIKSADKLKIPFVLCLGEDEIKTREYPIKNLKTGEEVKLKENEIFNFVKNK